LNYRLFEVAAVLCRAIPADDHGWLQEHATDVERCATYLHAGGIACAVAHPYYFVRRPLVARHLRVLAQLFPLSEKGNGSRAPAPRARVVDPSGRADTSRGIDGLFRGHEVNIGHRAHRTVSPTAILTDPDATFSTMVSA
jgi:hypothetical protein